MHALLAAHREGCIYDDEHAAITLMFSFLFTFTGGSGGGGGGGGGGRHGNGKKDASRRTGLTKEDNYDVSIGLQSLTQGSY